MRARSRTSAGAGCLTSSRTNPRLEDGTPFPTLYYLTCPRAASAIGRLEGSEGVMKTMTARLADDAVLKAALRERGDGLPRQPSRQR